MARGSLALKKGLAEGTRAGPGHVSRHDESSGHVEPVGAAGRGQRASQVRLCGVWGVEAWNPGAWWGQQLENKGAPWEGGKKKRRDGAAEAIGAPVLGHLPTKHPSTHSFLWPPHESPEPQLQQVYCWR